MKEGSRGNLFFNYSNTSKVWKINYFEQKFKKKCSICVNSPTNRKGHFFFEISTIRVFFSKIETSNVHRKRIV